MKKNVLIFSTALMVIAAGNVNAQTPNDPPVHNWGANDVHAIYVADDEQYTQAEGTGMTMLDWGGQDTMSDDEAGDYAALRIVAGSGNYSPLQFDKAQNWSNYKYLHMDVWAIADCQFYVVFRNWSAGVRSGSAVLQLKGQQWYSLDFDLSEFAWSEKNGQQERLVNVLVLGGESEGIYQNAAKADKVWITNIIANNNAEGTIVGVGKQEEKVIAKPETVAPTPTKNAGNVAAAFSDAYSQKLEWTLYGWSGCHFEDITVGTDHVTWMKDADYAAVAMSGDISDMEYMHADVWVPAEYGVTSVQFGYQLMNGMAPADKVGEFYSTEVLTPTPGEWVSVDLPLTSFEGFDKTVGKQVLRIKTNGGGTGNLYLDNIYFWNTKEVIEDSPVPAIPAAGISSYISIYGDFGTVSNFVKNGYSKGTAEEIQNEGNSLWKMTKFDYAKFKFDAVDLSNKEKFHIDFFTPSDQPVTTQIKVVLTDETNKASTVTSATTVTLTAGEWNGIDINLSEFNCDLTKVNLITLGAVDRNEQHLLYMGNVYAYDSSSDGIENVNSDNVKNNQIYNLAGQRVSPNTKGLLIQNGKKYVVK